MDTLRVQGRVRLDDLPEDTTWPRHKVIEGSLLVAPWPGVNNQAVVGDACFAQPSGRPRSTRGRTWATPVTSEATCSSPLESSEVLLVVEVVSPSTRLTDTVTKRTVYAERGIPVHVVVDPVTRTSTWHGDPGAVGWAEQAPGAILPAA